MIKVSFGQSMRSQLIQRTAVILTALFLAIAAWAAGKQTFTGQVSDAMCGREHMQGAATECTRTCVQHGSKYSLLVGDKVYTLETTDKAALSTLDQQAGKNATVTGTLNGDKLEVSTVAAAK